MKIQSRKRKIGLIVVVAVGVLMVGFLTWLIISLATQKTDLTVTQKYELPGFASMNNLPEVEASEMAVAIDGEVAIARNKIATLSAENGEASLPTASTAKMILGLAIMDAKPFELGTAGEMITITDEYYNRYAWYLNHNGSNTAVRIGEEISEYDALVAVFLASSNNMADTLAMWAFGSLENYRDYAEEMLHKWGINATVIGVDASGFDKSTTSTAADLARIGAKVLENPVLAEIVGTVNYEIPVAGVIKNTNTLLGESGIVGVKTGYIGDASRYCLVTGYREGEHIVTTALLGAPTREASFNESLAIVVKTQELVPEQKIISEGEVVGYYESWWTGPVAIKADTGLSGIGWAEAETDVTLEMTGETGALQIKIGEQNYTVPVTTTEYAKEPSFGERLAHLFGWQKESTEDVAETETKNTAESEPATDAKEATETTESKTPAAEPKNESVAFTNAPSNNCTIKFGALMLINPNFTVENEFIGARRGELISVSTKYGIVEGNAYNGDNLLDAEAAEHINEMVNAYKAAYPGHTMETRSCFRAVGTNCGRLCAATGTSDHHTGLTCDLLDPAYGTSLDTSTYNQHPDWQWLKANSYKYGFIDRFPEAWAGGSMDEPLNVDANGTTGLFETWHYRYVGVGPATEIATGKYNNGQYDSLEHYLLARGMVTDLKNGICK